MVTVLGSGAASGQTLFKPSISAKLDRLLCFEDEAIRLSGKVETGAVATVSVSGPVRQSCQVRDDGTFELEITPPGPGVQTLVVEAEGAVPVRLEFVVASGQVSFPLLFGTERTYQVGLVCGEMKEKITRVPYWAWQIGVDFLALTPGNGLSYDATLDAVLTETRRLGITVALIGGTDLTSLTGLPGTVKANGDRHERRNNLLSSEYQEGLKARLVALVTKARNPQSLRYILFAANELDLSPEEGYDLENLKRFAEQALTEPRGTIPPFSDAPGWYTFLKNDAVLWEKWLTYRRQLWTAFMVELRGAVRSVQSDIELGTIESPREDGGLWNVAELVNRGIMVHASQDRYPKVSYDPANLAAGNQSSRAGTSLFLAAPVRFDGDQRFERLLSGLFGTIKAGGSSIMTWSDRGQPLDSGFYSVVTEVIGRDESWQKVRPLLQAAYQVTGIPYKDRFVVYNRYGGQLPLQFSVDWAELKDQPKTIASRDGISAGDPQDSVYAVVQDFQPDQYVEILVFNDAAQKPRGETQQETDVSTLEFGSLRERCLTITVKPAEKSIPIVDGKAWMYFERKEDAIVIKGLLFKPQHIRFLQLVRCERDLPHLISSPILLSGTRLESNGSALWLDPYEPGQGTATAYCGKMGRPKDVKRGQIVSYDESTKIVTFTCNTRTFKGAKSPPAIRWE
jgi:hypothetical protein